MPTHALNMITTMSKIEIWLLSTERTAVIIEEIIKPTPFAQANNRIVVVGDLVASVVSSYIAESLCGGNRPSRLPEPPERLSSVVFPGIAFIVWSVPTGSL
mmetsp:Transcript_1365/g.2074  ORF Transcript_1365/g.2074 Transcript_1365/m.2074 type:complete len:101 (+) Transcript_1365:631-933(+)